MSIVILYSIALAIFSAWRDSLQIQQQEQWHRIAFLQRSFALIGFVGALLIQPDYSARQAVLLAFIGAFIFWLVFDLSINAFRGKKFDYLGDNFLDQLLKRSWVNPVIIKLVIVIVFIILYLL